MTDQALEQPQSFILVKFAEPGSVVFQSNMIGVTPYQLLAVAGYLETLAKHDLVELISQRKEEQEAQGLSKPNPKIMLPGQ